MGKTIRNKNYAFHGGMMMRERFEKPLPSAWYEARKEEKRLQRKLSKLQKK